MVQTLARQLAIYRHNSKQMSRQVTKKDFKKEVMDNMNLSLVHFKTEWNGACQIISAIYDDLERSYHGIAHFFSIDIEKEEGINEEFGIMELPTILFFRGGKVIDFAIGLTPKNVLITKIENALRSHNNSN
ncbi:MAG TPA: thioredoxin domain-containing protein [Chitinophagaceae bacterium]